MLTVGYVISAVSDMEQGKEDEIMQKIWRRLGSAGVAAAICLGMAQAVPAAVVSAEEPLLASECEDLTLGDGAVTAT